MMWGSVGSRKAEKDDAKEVSREVSACWSSVEIDGRGDRYVIDRRWLWVHIVVDDAMRSDGWAGV